MAASKRIFSLDLGTQSVTMAEFRAEAKGGLVLVDYRSTELLADPAADATRHAQARMAINEMVAAAGYKGQPVHYAIASQSVFTRFVKLPSVGEEQVDQIVTFEAHQNVPYPINEVVWDYQLVETGDSSQVEVVIVAIKSDLLDEINDSVEASGLRTALVDVSPMAIYNAYRYNYSDLDGCSLVVDVGARSTNLVFVEPRKVFSRSIATGGNTISAAIAKDFNEPFQAAEDRKKRDGFVSLGGAYADPDDPEVARISKITRNTMTRLHAEIARSITFYRSQQGGSQPVRVFLSGGATSMPYMREFFQEKMQMPVDYFNPLRNVTVGGHLNVEEIGRKAHTLGGLVGLALRSISSCPMELNLRPAGVIRRERAARQKPAFVLIALLVLAGLAGWWLHFKRATEITQGVIDQMEPRIAELQNYDRKMASVIAETKQVELSATPLLKTAQERDYWSRVLTAINDALPKEFVWITGFDPEIVTPPATPAAPTGPKGKNAAQAAAPVPTTVVQVHGLYLSNERDALAVDDFVNKLNESDLFTVKKDDEYKRSVPNESEWAFDFSFPLVLKNPITFTPPPARK